MAGAPVGNQNARHSRRWQQAIFRALSRASNLDIDKGLDEAADKLVSLALGGDKWALDHLADRVDGKAVQAIEGTLDAGSALLAILTGLSQGRDNALEARGSGAVREGSAGSDSNGSAMGGIPSSGRA